MRHLRIILAATALPLALSACGAGEETDGVAAEQAAGPQIKLQRVQTLDWRDVSAEVATVDQAQVLARIPGILTALTVREGDYVKAGQQIGRIVDSQLGYQSAAYGAQVAQAKTELDRVQFLHDNGVYAKARLDQARAAYEAVLAQQNAVKAVAGQGALVAPATGRVLAADVPAGSPVVPGMAIATITAGPVVLKLELPESLAASVAPGAQVIATLPGQGEMTGTIARLYPAVMGGQVRADVAVAGLDSTLIGRRIPARIAAGEREALLVPEEYVTTAYGIDTVRVLGADGTAASVPVQTAPAGEAGKLEILSGVSAGDTLVGKGA